MKFIKKHRNLLLKIIDIIVIAISYIAAETIITGEFIFTGLLGRTLLLTICMEAIIYSLILHMLDTYKNITRYENGKDYLVYVVACCLAFIVIYLVKKIFSIYMIDIRVSMVAAPIIVTSIVSYRVVIRFILTEVWDNKEKNSRILKKNILIVGAGEATKVLLGTLKTKMQDKYNIVGIIDDDEGKLNYAISGNKILGNRYDIPRICKERQVQGIFFTISNITNKEKKDILKICQETGCKVRILPGTADLIKDKNLISSFRNVEIEDLLGRDPIKLDNENIASLIEDKVVLVTGGGGSIGSELCRQISKYLPKKLIIVDIYENNLYNIEQELKFSYPDMELYAIVASVRDKKRLNEVFDEFKPYLVFHAAAHKHVPLMETSPLEAIKNNVFGTYNVVNCADEYNVSRFILISSDKAVNPTNIMGATKRLCEMIVQAKDRESKTKYVAVRFGNVLGSNGSVVPLFKRQIEAGGPVTVTHKEITRFFMTIPEAVSLILQAITYANGGEIFVLDMGEPIKIYDMAVNLIKLSGLVPDEDIKIKITGLRPGEKLYEELLMSEEGLTETKSEKIFIAKPMNINMTIIDEKLKELDYLIQNCSNEQKDEIKKVIKDVVPTYIEGK